MTKYIVLRNRDAEELFLLGFADNYVQAYAMVSEDFKKAEDFIAKDTNRSNTTIVGDEIKVVKMTNSFGFKLLQRVDVHTILPETKSLVNYTVVNSAFILAYDDENGHQLSSTDPEQLDMFTYMEGGYKDGGTD